MKEQFIDKNFRPASLSMIATANQIIADYQEQGYTLTLRQLYYQLVARDHIENSERSYKQLGNLISDGRLAGLIDWEAIEDRTRSLESYSNWLRPELIIFDAARSYRRDLWANQPYYAEVWVEKEALAGVVERACSTWRVPHFSCRGYVSQSEMYNAARRLYRQCERPDGVRLIHLGDHDPSGIDMSRDIQDRLRLMLGDDCYSRVDFQRIALNYNQIQTYNPPPNPAKTTDSRFVDYKRRFGTRSWELDALEPSVLVDLIQRAIEKGLDHEAWQEELTKEKKQTEQLWGIGKNFVEVSAFLKRNGK